MRPDGVGFRDAAFPGDAADDVTFIRRIKSLKLVWVSSVLFDLKGRKGEHGGVQSHDHFSKIDHQIREKKRARLVSDTSPPQENEMQGKKEEWNDCPSGHHNTIGACRLHFL